MEADEHFTRKESKLADEVFSKLYGFDADYHKIGIPFQEDKELIAQFKHELFTREDIAEVPLRQFPKTAAYKRCFSLPRTTEATEIESIMRALAPFIRISLEQNKLVTQVGTMSLTDIVPVEAAMQFMPEYKDFKKYVALCRPLIFCEANTNKPYPHSVVERGIFDCSGWLMTEFGLVVDPNTEPIPGGFLAIAGRYRMAPTARFCLAGVKSDDDKKMPSLYKEVPVCSETRPDRTGSRLRVNSKFKPDKAGCFETVNEMKPGTEDLKDKSNRVQYMDTFLLESDETSHLNVQLEKQRAEEWRDVYGDSTPIPADVLYRERLQASKKEAERIFNEGTACRLVYSGAKSYHLLVRVSDAPETLEEYSWLHAYLATSVSDKLVFDESTSDPARLTRSPLTMQRFSNAYGILVEGEQKLICEDWSHVYDLKWRELFDLWKKRPLKPYEQVNGRRLAPTRQEYKDAAIAILDESFWTDSKWDGERQRCFFPAYRILRLLGYSHSQLWEEGLMTKGVEKYKHPDEIRYWKTRDKSSIVQQVDAQIDEYVESLGDEDGKTV